MTTIAQVDLKQEILRVLERHVGRENPITAVELGERLGMGKLKNTYVLREAIAELIKADNPICSDDKGYWKGESWLEVNQCADGLKDRAIKIILRRRDLLRAANNQFNKAERVKLL